MQQTHTGANFSQQQAYHMGAHMQAYQYPTMGGPMGGMGQYAGHYYATAPGFIPPQQAHFAPPGFRGPYGYQQPPPNGYGGNFHPQQYPGTNSPSGFDEYGNKYNAQQAQQQQQQPPAQAQGGQQPHQKPQNPRSAHIAAVPTQRGQDKFQAHNSWSSGQVSTHAAPTSGDKLSAEAGETIIPQANGAGEEQSIGAGAEANAQQRFPYKYGQTNHFQAQQQAHLQAQQAQQQDLSERQQPIQS